MGRSVDYLNNNVGVTYIDISEEVENGFDWSDWLEDLTYLIKGQAKSLYKPIKDIWQGRETQIILENDHVYIGVSEYCELVSVSMAVRDDSHVPGLSEHWAEKMWPKIEKAIVEAYAGNSLRKIGSFSNGEGVFEYNK